MVVERSIFHRSFTGCIAGQGFDGYHDEFTQFTPSWDMGAPWGPQASMDWEGDGVPGFPWLWKIRDFYPFIIYRLYIDEFYHWNGDFLTQRHYKRSVIITTHISKICIIISQIYLCAEYLRYNSLYIYIYIYIHRVCVINLMESMAYLNPAQLVAQRNAHIIYIYTNYLYVYIYIYMLMHIVYIYIYYTHISTLFH